MFLNETWKYKIFLGFLLTLFDFFGE